MKRIDKIGRLNRKPKVRPCLGPRDDVPKGYSLKDENTLIRDSDGSEFVRIKEIELPKNVKRNSIGTQSIFSNLKESVFNSLSVESEMQEEATKELHGFWISKYPISFDDKGFHSLCYKVPISNVTFEEARMLATQFESREDLHSYLPSGPEIYMLIKHLEKENNINVSGMITIEGYFKDWKNGVYAFNHKDAFGTWTMETRRLFTSHVIFGGLEFLNDNNVAVVRYVAESYTRYADVGFFVVLLPSIS